MSTQEGFSPGLENLREVAHSQANKILDNYMHFINGARNSFSAYLLYPSQPEDPESVSEPIDVLHGIVYDRVEAGLGIRQHPYREGMAITSDGIELYVRVTEAEYEQKSPVGVEYSTEPFEQLAN